MLSRSVLACAVGISLQPAENCLRDIRKYEKWCLSSRDVEKIWRLLTATISKWKRA